MRRKCGILFALIAGSGALAGGATITVSSAIPPGFTLTGSDADARYKFDPTNWDMALLVPTTTTPTGHSLDLGNNISAFNGVTQNFTLAYNGSSLAYTLQSSAIGTKTLTATGLGTMNALDIAQLLNVPAGAQYSLSMTINNLAFTGATGDRSLT